MGVVVVGGGAAGFGAAVTCRALHPGKAVTLIDAEQEVGYYRTLLPQFMVGELPEQSLFFYREGTDPLLTVRTGVGVRSLDRTARRLVLSSGEDLAYDRLVLAHGRDPYFPGILTGPPARGIFPVRDLTTARAAKAWLADHRQVIVFGASLVAVKMAVHLRQAGFEVSLVVRRGHILLRALSPESAGVVESHMREMGIRIAVNSPLEEVRGEDGAVTGIKAGGEWISGNTLFVAAGATPDTAFLQGTGLLKDGQLVVSPALQTADPRIFAAGDVAVVSTASGVRLSPNTWPQAVSQGRTVARNLYRQTPLPHRDLTAVNAMELHGLAMIILGPPVDGAEVICHTRPAERLRRELFIVGGKAVGGALIGDISAAGTLHALITSGRDITPAYAALLRPHSRRFIPFPDHRGRREALILSTVS